jgi:hypothetical protein
MVDQEQRIRARAYRIWEEEGRPEGRAEVHWDMARATFSFRLASLAALGRSQPLP